MDIRPNPFGIDPLEPVRQWVAKEAAAAAKQPYEIPKDRSLPLIMKRLIFKLLMEDDLKRQRQQLGREPGPLDPLPQRSRGVTVPDWVRAFNIALVKLTESDNLLRPNTVAPFRVPNSKEREHVTRYRLGAERIRTERIEARIDDWLEELSPVVEADNTNPPEAPPQ